MTRLERLEKELHDGVHFNFVDAQRWGWALAMLREAEAILTDLHDHSGDTCTCFSIGEPDCAASGWLAKLREEEK